MFAAQTACHDRPPLTDLSGTASACWALRSASVAGRAVDVFAQEIGMPVVPRVLHEHRRVDPAQAHLGVALRVQVHLVEGAASRRLATELDLAPVGGEVLLRVRVLDVELRLEIVLTAVEVAD